MSGFEDFLSQSVTPQAPNAPAAPASLGANTDALSPPDDFGKFLAKLKAEPDPVTQQAKASVVSDAHAGINAATAGQAAKTGRELGIPQAAVETDPATYQATAKAQKNASIIGSNPVLAKWVAANPDSARIAQDEYEGLSNVEKLWQGTQDIGYTGIQSLAHGFANAAMGLNRSIAPLFNVLGAGDWFNKVATQPSEQTEASLRLPPDASLLKKIVSVPGELAALLSQVTLTAGAGAAPNVAAGVGETIVNAATHAGKAMAFPSLTASANTAHDTYAQTNDAAAAARAAVGAYLFSTVQGAVPFSAPGSVATRAVSGALSGAATSEGQRAAMNLLVPQTARDFDPQEAIFQAMSGAVLGGAMGPHADPHLSQGIRQTYSDALRATQAEQDLGKVQALGKIAAESKLREADPDAFKTFVESVTDKSELDAVYVDAVKLSEAFAQSEVRPTEAITESLKEALSTGGDVRIPIADYATHLAGTDIEKAILPDMKASADGMTMKEGQDFYAKATETMKAKAEEITQARQDQSDLDADKQSVHQNLMDQMVAAGRDPGIAKTEATLATEFYSSMAAREGMKPSEFLKANPLKFAQEGGGLEQPAYHGSPHDFDKFSSDKIGTGEGAQAYGHGLYFAENKDVAEGYKKALSTHVTTIDGKQLDPSDPRFAAAMSIAAKGYDKHIADTKLAIEKGFFEKDYGEKQLAAAEALKGVKIEQKQGGSVYTVDIPDEHVAKMLLWDKPLSEQPEAVKAALERAGILDDKAARDAHDDALEAALQPGGDASKPLPKLPPNPTGEQIYRRLSDSMMYRQDALDLTPPAKAASELLKSLGIPGIKYRDQGSRGSDEGTHNLVVFDDSIIKLTHKDGKPVTQAERDSFLQGPNEEPREMQEEIPPGIEPPRGSFNPDTRTISLLKGADLSTSVHELGHAFLDTLSKVAVGEKASEGVKADFKTLLDWFGVKDEASWHAMSLDEQRPFHEQLAKGFERYMFEGRAPTQALQPIFSRIRAWMLNVYQKLSNLGGDINPEVRGVFDRMLASDEAIKQAEQIRSYAPLFTDAKAFGGDEAKLSAYLKLGEDATSSALDSMQARSLRDMKWASNAKNKAIRAMQREALSARKEVQAQAEHEVGERPEYAAKDYLKANKGADKDIVSGMHGFDSAEHMQHAIDSAPNRKDAVRELTDQRMLQQHGELTDPTSVELAANEAVHNEARAKFMATGLKILTDSPLPANQIAKAAKEAAEATIAGKAVGDLRSDRYLAAEAKANKEAIKQAAKSPEKAVDAQRAAILNNRLAKAAMDAQAEVQKGIDFLKKFDKPTVTKAVGSEYMDRINELLSAYDITNRFSTGSDVAQRQQMRDWLNSEYQRTGVMPEVSDALMDFTQKRHWKELRVEEFRGLVDAVKSLEHVGREQQLVTVNGERVSLQDQVNRAKADMADMPHNPPVDSQPHLAHAEGLDKIGAQYLNFKSKLRGMDAALIKMEQLFQWLTYGEKAGLGETRTGPFLELMTRAGAAEGAERSMRAESAKAMKELGNSLRDAKVDINESLDIPGLPRKGRGTQWYREELLSAALNMGNKDGIKNLVEGNGFSERSLREALNTHLSAAEWKFVQGTLDHINSYWPHIESLQKRLVGVAPPKVDAVPIRDGVEGGYFPIVRDAFTDSKIDEHHAKDAASLFENQFSKPVTNKGHTVARTGYIGPLHLSLGNVARHIDQVTHDLAWREPIIDMNKFLSHSEITKEVDEVMGREYRKQFRPWLQSMANDKVFNTSGDTAWERFYRTARTNATLVGLGFRLSTMLIHGGSALSNSIGEVGPKWFAKGAAEFATPERWAGAKQFMYDRSPEMANRFNESDRNIHEAIDAINEHQRSLGPISATQKAVDGARRFAFYGVQALDMGSAAPTWMAAYLKGMAPEAKGGHGLSEEAAIEMANRSVRNAHGGGGVKDLSAVQRDKGVMSMATMFYSFWNHMYNRQRDLGKGFANASNPRDFARLLARSWWYFVIPQVLHAYLKPTPPGQDDSLEAELHHFASEVALGFVSGVPVLRDLANAVVNGRDYTITPLEQAGKSIVKAAVDTYKAATGQETSKHPVKNAAQAVGYAAGLPTGQLSQTGTFLWDVYNGDQDPQGIKDWYTGIQNGRIGK